MVELMKRGSINKEDKNTFIEYLKKEGGRGGLTLPIRSVIMVRGANVLYIKSKLKLQQTIFTKEENQAIIKKALLKMDVGIQVVAFLFNGKADYLYMDDGDLEWIFNEN